MQVQGSSPLRRIFSPRMSKTALIRLPCVLKTYLLQILPVQYYTGSGGGLERELQQCKSRPCEVATSRRLPKTAFRVLSDLRLRAPYHLTSQVRMLFGALVRLDRSTSRLHSHGTSIKAMHVLRAILWSVLHVAWHANKSSF